MGGESLVYTYNNYLSKDISDKIYSYQDFRDRDPREMLHGYYAGADAGGFYMWTLSGLNRFVASLSLRFFPLSSFLIQS